MFRGRFLRKSQDLMCLAHESDQWGPEHGTYRLARDPNSF